MCVVVRSIAFASTLEAYYEIMLMSLRVTGCARMMHHRIEQYLDLTDKPAKPADTKERPRVTGASPMSGSDWSRCLAWEEALG